MAITPVEIRNYEFQKKMRGFDPDEVENLIEEIAQEMEKQLKSNSLMKQEIENLNQRLKVFEEIESSLKKTLLTAQQAAEEQQTTVNKLVETKRREVELLVDTKRREAELDVEKIKNNAWKEIEVLEEEIGSLKKQKLSFAVELRAIIDTHLRLINQNRVDGLGKTNLEDVGLEKIELDS